MGLPQIFDSAQSNSFEQSLMMMTFELTSWLVGFLAIMTLIIVVLGILHMMRSESKKYQHLHPRRFMPAVNRVAPRRGRRIAHLSVTPTTFR